MLKNSFPTPEILSPIHRAFVLVYAQKTGKYLALLRADDQTWGLPGGKTHPGELAEAAIKRETMEETGFELNNPEQIYTFPVGDEKHCAIFLQSVNDEFSPTLNTESTDHAWATLEMWPLPAHPQMLRLISEAQSIIQAKEEPEQPHL